MDRTYAYVDESGNSDLDTSKAGSSGFFVICSIIVAEKDLQNAYQRARSIADSTSRQAKSSQVRCERRMLTGVFVSSQTWRSFRSAARG
ncbi:MULTISPECIES: DUF3800 domain-containing protein [unclassified Pseudomonas]|uniref:DUF3800 domain-containing protein n=1 Tax=unclassified Pseudomonas TaxID=196821 RepID=UPI00382CD7B8